MKEQKEKSQKPVNINISFTINPKNIINRALPISGIIKNQDTIQQNSGKFKEYEQNLFVENSKNSDQDKYTFRQTIENQENKTKKKKSHKRHSVDEAFKQSCSVNIKGHHKKNSWSKSGKSSVLETFNKTKFKNKNIADSKHGFRSQEDYREKFLCTQEKKSINHYNKSKSPNKRNKNKVKIQEPQMKNSIASKKKILKKNHRGNKSIYNIDASKEMKKKKIMEKLASLQSFNHIFPSQEDDSFIKKEPKKSYHITTGLSIEFLEEIQEYQKKLIEEKKSEIREKSFQNQSKYIQTKGIINTYLSLFNENTSEEETKMLVESLERSQKQEKLISKLSNHLNLEEADQEQVEMWEKMLDHIRTSLLSETKNKKQIISEINRALQKTKGKVESFSDKTSKFQEKSLSGFDNSISSFHDPNVNFDDGSSLKLLNINSLEHSLSNLEKNILLKKKNQLFLLNEQKIEGKMNELDFNHACGRVQKWSSKEIKEVHKVRKNLWKGFQGAINIFHKNSSLSARDSPKRMKLMKSLSEQYLRKSIGFIQEVYVKKQEQKNEQIERSPVKKLLSEEQIEQQQLQNIKSRLTELKNHQIQTILIDDFSLEEKKLEKSQISFYKEEIFNKTFQELIEEQNEPEYLQDEKKITINPQLPDSEPVNKKKNETFQGHGGVISNRKTFEQLDHDDREDIFEFIFLDMCIQMYQEPCQDNKIMKNIMKHIDLVKRQKNKKKGVRTSLNVVKEYLRRLNGYFLRKHRQNLKSIDIPLGPTAIEMLKYMHQGNQQQTVEQHQIPLVIPIHIFEQFDRGLLSSLQFQVYYENDEQKENTRVQFLKNVLHIHNKAVFDALNEYLDTMRPFGIWGQPFPWKRTTNFHRQITQYDREAKLTKSIDKVVESCSYVCGLLLQKEQSLVGNANISEQYLEDIKEDRLSRMLANQLAENEERWLFYDDEEAETLIQIGNMIFWMLIKEITLQINLLE